MQTILPMPASGQPRRGPPLPPARPPRRPPLAPPAGARRTTPAPLLSRTPSESAAACPAAWTSPGRSAPARPYRTSFMGDRSVGGQAGHRHHEVEIAAQLVDPPRVVIDERGALRLGEIAAREPGRRVGLEPGPDLGGL